MTSSSSLYGLLAEFTDPNDLVEATRQAYEAGYRQIDSYSPMPIEALAEAMKFRRTRMPLVILIGSIVGAIAGYLLQYWIAVIAYPLNVGGRPFHSWPAFIPVTFEMTILFGALAGVFGMLALNGLPRPHHPLFGVPAFGRASRDRFFLCIEATDEKFVEEETRALLHRVGAQQVYDVPQ